MKPPRTLLLVALNLTLGFTLACDKQTGIPTDDSARTDDSQKLLFDRALGSTGISPVHSMALTVSRLPEGTPITIRLQNTVSSASSKAGDNFEGTLDNPIVVEGQTAIARGTAVTGRVLAAKASGQFHDPGYLRIALVSITVKGRPMAIETSSLFVKGRSHQKGNLALGGVSPGGAALIGTSANAGKGAVIGSAPGATGGTSPSDETGKKEVSFGVENRLTFRIAQAVDLQ